MRFEHLNHIVGHRGGEVASEVQECIVQAKRASKTMRVVDRALPIHGVPGSLKYRKGVGYPDDARRRCHPRPRETHPDELVARRQDARVSGPEDDLYALLPKIVEFDGAFRNRELVAETLLERAGVPCV